jgi:hypothetical protein
MLAFCKSRNLAVTHVALAVCGNANVLLAHKALNAVTGDLAVTIEMDERSITLALGRNTYVLDALKVLSTVAVDVTGLIQVSQRTVTGDLAGNTVASLVTLLVGLAVGVGLAARRLLSGGSHSETRKHGGDKNRGLHFGKFVSWKMQ